MVSLFKDVEIIIVIFMLRLFPFFFAGFISAIAQQICFIGTPYKIEE